MGKFPLLPERYFLPLLTIGFTLLRLLTATLTDLGNDEVYYFTYAFQPDWNHFDHPPLVGILIRFFTVNLSYTGELFVRLPAIAGAVVNTFLIARCGQILSGKQAGLRAALLYNICIYTSIISGAMILPDSVQLIFWLLALKSVLDATKQTNDRSTNIHLLTFGLWAGLATMSKVHGVFLWAGLLGFVFFKRNEWLRFPVLYGSMAITALIISPILFWNIENDFITWTFHSERVEARGGLDFKSFLVTSLGQIAYLSPPVFVLAIAALRHFVGKGKIAGNDQVSVLLWLSIPILLCTAAVSLLRPTLPHWGGPGFVGLLLLIASYLEQQKSRWSDFVLNVSLALTLLVFTAGLAVVRLYPGTMGKTSGTELGKGDITLDMYGWKALLPEFEKIRNDDLRSGKMSSEAPVAVHKWFPGGHVFYYLAYPLNIPVRGIGKLGDLHKFHWINKLSTPIPSGGNAYYITPSNYFTEPNQAFPGAFKTCELAATIPQYRNGRIARYWYVYRLKNAFPASWD